MPYITVKLVVTLTIFCAFVRNGSAGQDSTRKETDCGKKPVVSKSSVSNFPWFATIYTQKIIDDSDVQRTPICGATVIHFKVLLTAAHCVYDEDSETTRNPSEFSIATGNAYSDWDSIANWASNAERKASVKNIYTHCDYRGSRGKYSANVALLELEEPIEPSWILFMPVCFDASKAGVNFLQYDSYGIVTGFGRTDYSPIAEVLQYLEVPYVSLDECRQSLGIRDDHLLTLDKFCAGWTNGSAVSDGDGGGGLIFQGQGDISYVIGIVSVVSENIYTYGIYTKVETYVDWIKDVLDHVDRNETYPTCTIHNIV